jgi:hypothetical protein
MKRCHAGSNRRERKRCHDFCQLTCSSADPSCARCAPRRTPSPSSPLVSWTPSHFPVYLLFHLLPGAEGSTTPLAAFGWGMAAPCWMVCSVNLRGKGGVRTQRLAGRAWRAGWRRLSVDRRCSLSGQTTVARVPTEDSSGVAALLQ